ncbi:MAG: MoaD/ThiS family protein [Gemmatimonadaceae bacterium]|nr:MoaD/ThiS family protein [Gemmatimonadaceae bacterium]
MSVPVLLFASYADAFGARRVEVPVETPIAVSALVAAMRQLPGGDRLPARPLVAVNRTWVDDAVIIATNDEVAVIPPVAGG